MFLRHLLTTLAELGSYCWSHDRLWPFLLVLVLLLAGFVAGGTAVLTPYIYSIF